MHKDGCPKAEGFTWKTGLRHQQTETRDPSSSSSQPFRLAGEVNKWSVEQKFCMKTEDGDPALSTNWPKGRYCIYKAVGSDCPNG